MAGAAVVAGCSSPLHRAPVEDRPLGTGGASAPRAGAPAPSPSAGAEGARPVPMGAENAGKPGYYTVKPGDTLIRVGLETGQNWRDLQRWNSLENANLLEVGQVLRVVPPGQDASVVATRPVTSIRVEPRPLDAKAPTAGGSAPSASAPAPAATPTVAAAPAPAAAPTPPAATDDDPGWAWPASGPVLTGFDEARNKGLSIGGKAGDPVLAAADGRVVYAGSGLRGYGNLVIIKHNATFLTAYAHNQTLLVKEDQAVKRGQKIAEMGSSDADRVKLHFEIRRQGKPVDPARLLPSR
jgi:lipoprotein NlpD